MTKYLDENGLAYFWTKIKAWLSSHAPVKYFGRNWNVDTNDDYALVVGNGADGNNPKDVFMIEHDGDLVIGGDDSSKSVSFRGENTTETMIEFESNSDNADGNGLAFGADGRILIGSGGGVDYLKTFLANYGIDDPNLYLAAGEDVHIYTNTNNPSDASHLHFDKSGNVWLDECGASNGRLYQKSAIPSSQIDNANQVMQSITTWDSNDDVIGWIETYRKGTSDPNGIGLYKSFVAYNPISQIRNGIYFHVNDDGTTPVQVTDPTAFRKALQLGTNGNFPLTIPQGGSGQTNVIRETNISNVITPASGITINSVAVAKWGFLCFLRINWKRNAAITVPANGNCSAINIGVLKGPYQFIFKGPGLGFGNNADSQGAIYEINAGNGALYLTGVEGTGSARTIAANTSMEFTATYCVTDQPQ